MFEEDEEYDPLEYKSRDQGSDRLVRAWVVALLDGAKQAGRTSVSIDDIILHCILSQKTVYPKSTLRAVLYDLLLQGWVKQKGEEWCLKEVS